MTAWGYGSILAILIETSPSFTSVIKGTIPSSLSLLTGLKTQTFSFNPSLSGELPKSLASLTALQVLQNARCRLSGTIPESLSSLTDLNSVVLIFNRLSGTIPINGFPRMTHASRRFKADWVTTDTAKWQSLLTWVDDKLIRMDDTLSFLDDKLPGNSTPVLARVVAALLYGLSPDQNQLFLMMNRLSGSLPKFLMPASGCELEVLDVLGNYAISGTIPASLVGCSSLLWLTTGVGGVRKQWDVQGLEWCVSRLCAREQV